MYVPFRSTIDGASVKGIAFSRDPITVAAATGMDSTTLVDSVPALAFTALDTRSSVSAEYADSAFLSCQWAPHLQMSAAEAEGGSFNAVICSFRLSQDAPGSPGFQLLEGWHLIALHFGQSNNVDFVQIVQQPQQVQSALSQGFTIQSFIPPSSNDAVPELLVKLHTGTLMPNTVLAAVQLRLLSTSATQDLMGSAFILQGTSTQTRILDRLIVQGSVSVLTSSQELPDSGVGLVSVGGASTVTAEGSTTSSVVIAGNSAAGPSMFSVRVSSPRRRDFMRSAADTILYASSRVCPEEVGPSYLCDANVDLHSIMLNNIGDVDCDGSADILVVRSHSVAIFNASAGFKASAVWLSQSFEPPVRVMNTGQQGHSALSVFDAAVSVAGAVTPEARQGICNGLPDLVIPVQSTSTPSFGLLFMSMFRNSSHGVTFSQHVLWALGDGFLVDPRLSQMTDQFGSSGRLPAEIVVAPLGSSQCNRAPGVASSWDLAVSLTDARPLASRPIRSVQNFLLSTRTAQRPNGTLHVSINAITRVRHGGTCGARSVLLETGYRNETELMLNTFWSPHFYPLPAEDIRQTRNTFVQNFGSDTWSVGSRSDALFSADSGSRLKPAFKFSLIWTVTVDEAGCVVSDSIFHPSEPAPMSLDSILATQARFGRNKWLQSGPSLVGSGPTIGARTLAGLPMFVTSPTIATYNKSLYWDSQQNATSSGERVFLSRDFEAVPGGNREVIRGCTSIQWSLLGSASMTHFNTFSLPQYDPTDQSESPFFGGSVFLGDIDGTDGGRPELWMPSWKGSNNRQPRSTPGFVVTLDLPWYASQTHSAAAPWQHTCDVPEDITHTPSQGRSQAQAQATGIGFVLPADVFQGVDGLRELHSPSQRVQGPQVSHVQFGRALANWRPPPGPTCQQKMLVVGAPGAQLATGFDATQGAVYLLHWSADVSSASQPSRFDVASASALTPLNVTLLIGSTERGVGAWRNALFGWAVATHDLNGDGVQDILIGAPGASISKSASSDELQNVGAVCTAHMNAEGALTASMQDSRMSANLIGYEDAGLRLGSAVAAFQHSGYGLVEVAAGIPGYCSPASTVARANADQRWRRGVLGRCTGAIVIARLDIAGSQVVTTAMLGSLNGGIFAPEQRFIVISPQSAGLSVDPGDEFGAGLATFTLHAWEYIAIAAPGRTPTDSRMQAAGSVFVLRRALVASSVYSNSSFEFATEIAAAVHPHNFLTNVEAIRWASSHRSGDRLTVSPSSVVPQETGGRQQHLLLYLDRSDAASIQRPAGFRVSIDRLGRFGQPVEVQRLSAAARSSLATAGTPPGALHEAAAATAFNPITAAERLSEVAFTAQDATAFGPQVPIVLGSLPRCLGELAVLHGKLASAHKLSALSHTNGTASQEAQFGFLKASCAAQFDAASLVAPASSRSLHVAFGTPLAVHAAAAPQAAAGNDYLTKLPEQAPRFTPFGGGIVSLAGPSNWAVPGVALTQHCNTTEESTAQLLPPIPKWRSGSQALIDAAELKVGPLSLFPAPVAAGLCNSSMAGWQSGLDLGFWAVGALIEAPPFPPTETIIPVVIIHSSSSKEYHRVEAHLAAQPTLPFFEQASFISSVPVSARSATMCGDWDGNGAAELVVGYNGDGSLDSEFVAVFFMGPDFVEGSGSGLVQGAALFGPGTESWDRFGNIFPSHSGGIKFGSSVACVGDVLLVGAPAAFDGRGMVMGVHPPPLLQLEAPPSPSTGSLYNISDVLDIQDHLILAVESLFSSKSVPGLENTTVSGGYIALTDLLSIDDDMGHSLGNVNRLASGFMLGHRTAFLGDVNGDGQANDVALWVPGLFSREELPQGGLVLAAIELGRSAQHHNFSGASFHSGRFLTSGSTTSTGAPLGSLFYTPQFFHDGVGAQEPLDIYIGPGSATPSLNAHADSVPDLLLTLKPASSAATKLHVVAALLLNRDFSVLDIMRMDDKGQSLDPAAPLGAHAFLGDVLSGYVESAKRPEVVVATAWPGEVLPGTVRLRRVSLNISAVGEQQRTSHGGDFMLPGYGAAGVSAVCMASRSAAVLPQLSTGKQQQVWPERVLRAPLAAAPLSLRDVFSSTGLRLQEADDMGAMTYPPTYTTQGTDTLSGTYQLGGTRQPGVADDLSLLDVSLAQQYSRGAVGLLTAMHRSESEGRIAEVQVRMVFLKQNYCEPNCADTPGDMTILTFADMSWRNMLSPLGVFKDSAGDRQSALEFLGDADGDGVAIDFALSFPFARNDFNNITGGFVLVITLDAGGVVADWQSSVSLFCGSAGCRSSDLFLGAGDGGRSCGSRPCGVGYALARVEDATGNGRPELLVSQPGYNGGKGGFSMLSFGNADDTVAIQGSVHEVSMAAMNTTLGLDSRLSAIQTRKSQDMLAWYNVSQVLGGGPVWNSGMFCGTTMAVLPLSATTGIKKDQEASFYAGPGPQSLPVGPGGNRGGGGFTVALTCGGGARYPGGGREEQPHILVVQTGVAGLLSVSNTVSVDDSLYYMLSASEWHSKFVLHPSWSTLGGGARIEALSLVKSSTRMSVQPLLTVKAGEITVRPRATMNVASIAVLVQVNGTSDAPAVGTTQAMELSLCLPRNVGKFSKEDLNDLNVFVPARQWHGLDLAVGTSLGQNGHITHPVDPDDRVPITKMLFLGDALGPMRDTGPVAQPLGMLDNAGLSEAQAAQHGGYLATAGTQPQWGARVHTPLSVLAVAEILQAPRTVALVPLHLEELIPSQSATMGQSTPGAAVAAARPLDVFASAGDDMQAAAAVSDLSIRAGSDDLVSHIHDFMRMDASEYDGLFRQDLTAADRKLLIQGIDDSFPSPAWDGTTWGISAVSSGNSQNVPWVGLWLLQLQPSPEEMTSVVFNRPFQGNTNASAGQFSFSSGFAGWHSGVSSNGARARSIRSACHAGNMDGDDLGGPELLLGVASKSPEVSFNFLLSLDPRGRARWGALADRAGSDSTEVDGLKPLGESCLGGIDSIFAPTVAAHTHTAPQHPVIALWGAPSAVSSTGAVLAVAFNMASIVEHGQSMPLENVLSAQIREPDGLVAANTAVLAQADLAFPVTSSSILFGASLALMPDLDGNGILDQVAIGASTFEARPDRRSSRPGSAIFIVKLESPLAGPVSVVASEMLSIAEATTSGSPFSSLSTRSPSHTTFWQVSSHALQMGWGYDQPACPSSGTPSGSILTIHRNDFSLGQDTGSFAFVDMARSLPCNVSAPAADVLQGGVRVAGYRPVSVATGYGTDGWGSAHAVQRTRTAMAGIAALPDWARKSLVVGDVDWDTSTLEVTSSGMVCRTDSPCTLVPGNDYSPPDHNAAASSMSILALRAPSVEQPPVENWMSGGPIFNHVSSEQVGISSSVSFSVNVPEGSTQHEFMTIHSPLVVLGGGGTFHVPQEEWQNMSDSIIPQVTWLGVGLPYADLQGVGQTGALALRAVPTSSHMLDSALGDVPMEFLDWHLPNAWVGVGIHAMHAAALQEARVGWSMAALEDLNGDGTRDLLVGAPGFGRSATQVQSEQQVTGRIGGGGAVLAMFISCGNQVLRTVPTEWMIPFAAFGAAVASPGDLDGDGVNEWLVAAPMQGSDAVGLVHPNGNTAVAQVPPHSCRSGPCVEALLAGSPQSAIQHPLFSDLDSGSKVPPVAVYPDNPSHVAGAVYSGGMVTIFPNADGTVKAATVLGAGLGGLPLDLWVNHDGTPRMPCLHCAPFSSLVSIGNAEFATVMPGMVDPAATSASAPTQHPGAVLLFELTELGTVAWTKVIQPSTQPAWRATWPWWSSIVQPSAGSYTRDAAGLHNNFDSAALLRSTPPSFTSLSQRRDAHLVDAFLLNRACPSPGYRGVTVMPSLLYSGTIAGENMSPHALHGDPAPLAERIRKVDRVVTAALVLSLNTTTPNAADSHNGGAVALLFFGKPKAPGRVSLGGGLMALPCGARKPLGYYGGPPPDDGFKHTLVDEQGHLTTGAVRHIQAVQGNGSAVLLRQGAQYPSGANKPQHCYTDGQVSMFHIPSGKWLKKKPGNPPEFLSHRHIRPGALVPHQHGGLTSRSNRTRAPFGHNVAFIMASVQEGMTGWHLSEPTKAWIRLQRSQAQGQFGPALDILTSAPYTAPVGWLLQFEIAPSGRSSIFVKHAARPDLTGMVVHGPALTGIDFLLQSRSGTNINTGFVGVPYSRARHTAAGIPLGPGGANFSACAVAAVVYTSPSPTTASTPFVPPPSISSTPSVIATPVLSPSVSASATASASASSSALPIASNSSHATPASSASPTYTPTISPTSSSSASILPQASATASTTPPGQSASPGAGVALGVSVDRFAITADVSASTGASWILNVRSTGSLAVAGLLSSPWLQLAIPPPGGVNAPQTVEAGPGGVPVTVTRYRLQLVAAVQALPPGSASAELSFLLPEAAAQRSAFRGVAVTDAVTVRIAISVLAPSGVYAPQRLDDTVAPGTQTDRILSVVNTGLAALEVSFSIQPVAGHAAFLAALSATGAGLLSPSTRLTVPPRQVQQVQLSPETALLSKGEYRVELVAQQHNDPRAPFVVIPWRLTVTSLFVCPATAAVAASAGEVKQLPIEVFTLGSVQAADFALVQVPVGVNSTSADALAAAVASSGLVGACSGGGDCANPSLRAPAETPDTSNGANLVSANASVNAGSMWLGAPWLRAGHMAPRLPPRAPPAAVQVWWQHTHNSLADTPTSFSFPSEYVANLMVVATPLGGADASGSNDSSPSSNASVLQLPDQSLTRVQLVSIVGTPSAAQTRSAQGAVSIRSNEGASVYVAQRDPAGRSTSQAPDSLAFSAHLLPEGLVQSVHQETPLRDLQQLLSHPSVLDVSSAVQYLPLSSSSQGRLTTGLFTSSQHLQSALSHWASSLQSSLGVNASAEFVVTHQLKVGALPAPGLLLLQLQLDGEDTQGLSPGEVLFQVTGALCQAGSEVPAAGNTVCVCAPGFGNVASAAASATCTACARGSFSTGGASTGQASCQPCIAGTFSQSGAPQCKACPAVGGKCVQGEITLDPGFYAAPTVNLLNLPDSAQFHECINPFACRNLNAVRVAAQAAVAYSTARMEGSGGQRQLAVDISGFIRASGYTTLTPSSDTPQYPPELAADNASVIGLQWRLTTEGYPPEFCSEGYRGPLCAVCEDGYALASPGVCEKCWDAVSNWLVTALVLGAAVAFVTVSSMRVQAEGTPPNCKSDDTMVIVRVGLNWLQLYGTLAAFSAPKPSALASIFDTGGGASQGVSLSLFPTQCAMQLSFAEKVAGTLLLPVVAVAAAFGVVGLIYTARQVALRLGCASSSLSVLSGGKRQGATLTARNWSWDHLKLYAIRGSVVSMFVLYLAVARTALSVFALYPQKIAGKSHLREDMSVTTSDRQYAGLAAGAGVALFVFVLGAPIAAMFVLRRHRDDLDSARVRSQFDLLYDGYIIPASATAPSRKGSVSARSTRLATYMFELLVLLRKVLFAAIPIVVRDMFLQLHLALAFVLMALLLHLAGQPFASQLVNRLETATLSATAITLLGLMFIHSGRVEDLRVARLGLEREEDAFNTTREIGVEVLLLVVNALVMALLVVCGVASASSTARDMLSGLWDAAQSKLSSVCGGQQESAAKPRSVTHVQNPMLRGPAPVHPSKRHASLTVSRTNTQVGTGENIVSTASLAGRTQAILQQTVSSRGQRKSFGARATGQNLARQKSRASAEFKAQSRANHRQAATAEGSGAVKGIDSTRRAELYSASTHLSHGLHLNRKQRSTRRTGKGSSAGAMRE